MISYVEKGSGAAVVLVHGYCGSGRYWEEVFPLLAANHRVVAVDLRGHGDSPAGEGPYSMERLADDVLELLDGLKIGQAFLFGHSLGGYVALSFAERYEDRLLGLGLLHSTSLPDGEAAKENRLKAAEAIRTGGVRSFVDGLVPKLFAPAHRDSMPDKVAKAKEIGYGTSPEGAAGCALGMRERPDRTRVLEEAKVPVLLLAGELDEVIPADRRFPVAEGKAERTTIAGAGHMGMMESPEAFAEAILHFLKKNG